LDLHLVLGFLIGEEYQ